MSEVKLAQKIQSIIQEGGAEFNTEESVRLELMFNLIKDNLEGLQSNIDNFNNQGIKYNADELYKKLKFLYNKNYSNKDTISDIIPNIISKVSEISGMDSNKIGKVPEEQLEKEISSEFDHVASDMNEKLASKKNINEAIISRISGITGALKGHLVDLKEHKHNQELVLDVENALHVLEEQSSKFQLQGSMLKTKLEVLEKITQKEHLHGDLTPALEKELSLIRQGINTKVALSNDLTSKATPSITKNKERLR